MNVEVETHGRVAVVTLVDVERRNAMSAPMVAQIVAAFDRLEDDGEIGAVVVTGEPPAFCSGANLSNLGSMSEGTSERGAVVSIYEGFLRVLRSSLPTVAAVNGPAVGAGMNLALACDLRVAGESARFDTRFLRIGIHPGGGHAWMLERAVGPQAAAAMILFGEVLGGRRAAEVGLAWSVHPDGELLDAAVALAERAASVPKDLTARTKETLRRAPWQPSFDEAVALEIDHQTWSLGRPYFAEIMAASAARASEKGRAGHSG